MMKNFNWSKYSKPIILVAFIVVLSILRPKAFLSLDNFSNVLWSVAVIGIMVSGSIFVFLIETRAAFKLAGHIPICGVGILVVVEILTVFAQVAEHC